MLELAILRYVQKCNVHTIYNISLIVNSTYQLIFAIVQDTYVVTLQHQVSCKMKNMPNVKGLNHCKSTDQKFTIRPLIQQRRRRCAVVNKKSVTACRVSGICYKTSIFGKLQKTQYIAQFFNTVLVTQNLMD